MSAELLPSLRGFAKGSGLFCGALLIAIAVFRGHSHSGSWFRHFGVFTITFLVFGGLLLGASLRARGDRALGRILSLSSGIFFAYLALLGVNYTAYLVRSANAIESDLSWRAIFEPAREPFLRKLQPNIERSFHYGGQRIRLHTNSLGHRDDELAFRPGVRNVVLSGDSFTFGFGVDQEDKFDRKMEKLASRDGVALDVYNIGYAGSCALHTEREFRDFAPEHATDYVYVFHSNDVMELIHAERELTVHKGVLVERFKPDGRAFSSAELDDMLDLLGRNVVEARLGKSATGLRWWTDLLSFSLVRKATSVATVRNWYLARKKAAEDRATPPTLADRAKSESAARLPDCDGLPSLSAERTALVKRTVGLVGEMAATAKRRGVSFWVTFTPSADEVREKAYYPEVQAVICGLKKLKVTSLIDAIHYLREEDYIPLDGHYNAKGTALLGELMYRHVLGTKGGRNERDLGAR